MSSVPVIDFNACKIGNQHDLDMANVKKVGKEIFDAFKTHGYVYLKNTGVSNDEIEAAYRVAEKFFKAPYEQKKKYLKRDDNHGYVSLLMEQLNPDPNGPRDYKEAYNINGYLINDPDIPWPNEISPDFYKTLTSFAGVCKDLSLRILRVLASGMKLIDSEEMVKRHSLMHQQGNYTTFRSAYFPPPPESDRPGHIKVGEHSDYGSIGLVFQNDVGRLQVKRSEEYVDVPLVENAVFVAIGDILEFWSGSKVQPTRYRVVEDPEKKDGTRRSMSYFVMPDNAAMTDEELISEECTPEFISSAPPPKMTTLDYVNIKLREIFELQHPSQ